MAPHWSEALFLAFGHNTAERRGVRRRRESLVAERDVRDVTVVSGVLAGCRRAALSFAVVAVALLLPASAAQAQRLLTLISGVGEAASVGDTGPSIGPVPTAVQVDLELLRGAPARLEVPTPDGSVLSAERSVFEDRGGGDLMWSGGQPDAGYDTVVLTVEGGRLVGRFGAAGGAAYEIHADPRGIGHMTVTISVGYPVPWCVADSVPDSRHGLTAAAAAGSYAVDPPERVSSLQSHDRLDILVAYTAKAAENWADRGGARAAIQHAGDHLKMVFRNSGIEAEPHIVHIAQVSGALERVGRDVRWHEYDSRYISDPLHREIRWNGELLRLRHEHGADLIHVFVGERPTLFRKGDSFVCGGATLWSRNTPPKNAWWQQQVSGYTMNHAICRNYAATFVRQIGYTLGAYHNPENGVFLRPWKPYAFAHANFDVMPSIGTAMSCRGQVEPFFSSPATQLHGAVLGLAGERDNARALREAINHGVGFSDYLESVEGAPAPPSNLRGEYLEPGRARLTWKDNAPDADGYDVEFYREAVNNPDGSVRLGPYEHDWERRDEAAISLPVSEPGTRYRLRVRAWKGETVSLPSSSVTVVVPGERIKAPSDVSVEVDRWLSPVVRWTDNSDNEAGFEVQLLQDGEPIVRQRTQLHKALIWRHALPRIGAEYGVRVFAYNSSGYSESSEVETFRWAHPRAPRAPGDVAASVIGPTTVQVTWTADRGDTRAYRVSAELPGWRHAVDVLAGTRSVDIEGLARGGRYLFRVYPQGYTSLASATYLSLGERGTGPQAPSNVAWTTQGGVTRLSWNDRSHDELGFEVQSRVGEAELWTRELILPPDTESVVLPDTSADVVRIFAYNERGFSRSSPQVFAPRGSPPPDDGQDDEPPGDGPGEPPGSCKADSRSLCLLNSRFSVEVEWMAVDGRSGTGTAVPEGTDDSGMFWFFGPDNWEVLVKVLDGCSNNNHVWVFGASTTNLGYSIQVTDTVTGESRSYRNESGSRAPAITDTEAFSTPCGGSGS